MQFKWLLPHYIVEQVGQNFEIMIILEVCEVKGGKNKERNKEHGEECLCYRWMLDQLRERAVQNRVHCIWHV